MPHIAKVTRCAHAHTADLSWTTPAASSRAAGLPLSPSPPSRPRPNQYTASQSQRSVRGAHRAASLEPVRHDVPYAIVR